MLPRDVEQKIKDFPAKIKADNVSILALHKAMVNLPKAQANNVKENLNFSSTLSKFDQTQECNENFIQVYQQMRQAIQYLNDHENEKENKIRELAGDVQLFHKENAELAREVQQRGTQNTGIGLMNNDLVRIQRHKKLFQRFVYAEMKAHAKQFEIYCKLFEDVSSKINIMSEFQGVMIKGGKFQPAELQEYMQYKLKSATASDLANQFRGGIQQPRSQSQQRTPMRGMGATNEINQQSNSQSQQRGRSEAPPELGRR
eukprot:403349784